MNRNHPDVQRRTAPDGCLVLSLDIERVLGVSARQSVGASFRFSPEAPWIVSVELLVEGGPCVRWRIGRDLLQQGLHSMSGLGDVQMWPSSLEDRATSWLQLCSGDMAALFELPVPPLAEWLERTYELVPAERELAGVDWDVATAGLLSARRAQCD
ncbi:SsgA family sporulation/cell division regulator [Streptomyces sp. E5N91]|uniref:SsgA family sporulation/cell division regulator n=1 Tax=Streptomyces sp. E5N91 TaxID=1851996 RepID=UPI000EF5AADB|nr:SsgA family sporulation/cell division regulator [Streptomyces sp. E5N91]